MTYQINLNKYNGLANRRLQPLGHLSSADNHYVISVSLSKPRAQIPHMGTNKVGLGRTTKGNSDVR